MRGYPRSGLSAAGLIALAVVVAACSAALAFTSPEPGKAAPALRVDWPPPTAKPTPLARTPGPGVADLLAHPPERGKLVEVDAYFSGAGLVPHGGGAQAVAGQVLCPSIWEAALTDRPFQGLLSVLDGMHSNLLADDVPWLFAVSPEAIRPGVRSVPELPYHARLRGYLGDPAFAHCPNAARVFVVTEVVRVYAEAPPDLSRHELPAGYASWPRHHEPALGYSLPWPPGWHVEPLGGSTIALRSPRWPGYPVTVCAYEGETHYDPYDAASAPPLLRDEGWGVYKQGSAFEGRAQGQRLAGYQVERCALPRDRTVAVLYSGGGRTYELALRYPLGFEAPQPLLTAYTAIVEGFRLDAPPGPSPTPPVRQSLGAGPFLSQEDVLARVSARAGQEVGLVAAELVPEAEARRRAGACSGYAGHSEGVWVLEVRGPFEGVERTMRLLLDAATGESLCSEEVDADAAGDSVPEALG